MKWIGSVVVAALFVGACASGPGSVDGASSLHGIVFDGAGAALAGVEVEVTDVTGETSRVSSDVRGRFVVPRITAGRIAIAAGKPGYEPARVEESFLDATQIVYLRLRSARELIGEAESLLETDRPAAALAAARHALEIGPDDPVVRYAFAAIAASSGEYAEARAALAWFPDDEPRRAVARLRDLIAKEESR